MIQLRSTGDLARGEMVILCNVHDSKVIADFLNQCNQQKILPYVTIGDLNVLVKNAQTIIDKNLQAVVVEKPADQENPDTNKKSVKVEFKELKDGEEKKQGE